MGFEPQSNLWQCGPFALKHALAILGIFVDERELAGMAGTDREAGTDELQLARAARRFDCDLLHFREHDPEVARRQLIAYLRENDPVLICAYEWKHWITVVNESQGRFILLDSRDEAVLRICSRSEFESLWAYHRKDEVDPRIVEVLYDFHPVIPRFRAPARADVSLARARYLRRQENRELAKQWDMYVEDLLAVCRPRTALSSNVLSLGEFLRRHGDMMVDQVAFWHGWIEKRRARKVLRNLRFVADTYGLVIPEEGEKRAIAGLTALLTLWASGRYGVTPVYQESARPRSRRGK